MSDSDIQVILEKIANLEKSSIARHESHHESLLKLEQDLKTWDIGSLKAQIYFQWFILGALLIAYLTKAIH